ncbi:MAG: TIGR01212 family radical SAM protein [Clostridiales bacterium]|nr:TIGR01212 family radical SAM protein [Clostridiales bacterium]
MYEKPYLSAGEFYKRKFGERIIKIPLNLGLTCPNRDGTRGSGGCIFCSAAGSGDFAGSPDLSITEQFYQIKAVMDKKWKSGAYMPYFQAFTNTYAPTAFLRSSFYEAASLPNVKALSIATRPDCLESDKIELIKELNEKLYTCVELGLQTSNEKTGRFINRCFDNSCFETAVKSLEGIDVIAHIILGLPGETKEDMLASVRFAVNCGVKGIKLQLLHVLKNTALGKIYEEKPFPLPTLEEYADLVVSCVEALPENVVVHRITGDGRGQDLIAPLYSKNKKLVINTINREFVKRNTKQGNKYNCRKTAD